MKTPLIKALGLLLLTLPLTIHAQTSPGAGTNNSSTTGSTTNNYSASSTTQNSTMSDSSLNAYGPKKNDNEFTLSGSGSSNKHLKNSAGGVDFSLGDFVTDTSEILIRQTANWDDVPGGGSNSSFSTRIAFDQHFSDDRLRPFLGVNFGFVYGNAVRNSLAAGLEGGLKYYVHPRTFLFALIDYSFLFRSSNQISDRFDNGAFFWNVGVGFQF